MNERQKYAGWNPWHGCTKVSPPFCFHQTGAKLMKNGKVYNIMRRFQISQARKAGIDYRIGPDQEPIL